MQTISIDQIIVPKERQRKHFDEEALQKLSEDIVENDLINPITLRADRRTLVAGERRLRALRTYVMPLGVLYKHDGQVVPQGHIPYTTVSDGDALALMAKEFAENAARQDLTWQEIAETQAALHRLRQAYLDQKGAEHGVTYAPQTAAETAAEIHGRSDGYYQDSVRKNLILAQNLDNPEVAKAKTAKDAFKILERQEQSAKHSALAAVVGKTFSASMHQAIHADALEWMAFNASIGSFDVILTDPPYGMGADKFGDAAGKLLSIDHNYDDSYENWQRLMRGFAPLSFRVAKPQAHAYVFCDFDRFHELKGLMEAAGWYVFRTPIINVKESGRVPLPDQGPRRQYEICLYAIKGGKTTTGIYPDVVQSTADEQMGHGAQKPVSLYVDLLRRSVRPGDLVLDAFSGSGTIFPAASECKVRAVGIEMNPASYGKGVERLQALIQAEAAQPKLL